MSAVTMFSMLLQKCVCHEVSINEFDSVSRSELMFEISSCGKWSVMNSTFLMAFACAKLENTSELYTNRVLISELSIYINFKPY